MKRASVNATIEQFLAKREEEKEDSFAKNTGRSLAFFNYLDRLLLQAGRTFSPSPFVKENPLLYLRAISYRLEKALCPLSAKTKEMDTLRCTYLINQLYPLAAKQNQTKANQILQHCQTILGGDPAPDLGTRDFLVNLKTLPQRPFPCFEAHSSKKATP